MAFPDRQWARSWRKFVQDRFWLDSLQMGQLLLLLLGLFTMLLLLMFSFCCCFPLAKRRGHKRNNPVEAINRRPSATFGTSNEERRRLLLPPAPDQKLATVQTQQAVDGQIGQGEGQKTLKPNSPNPTTANETVKWPGQQQQQQQQQMSPFGGYRRILVEQSPPPPRRLAPPGGKTQVLPLTGGNRRRVPALVLLMADQEQRQQQSVPNSAGRSVGTPESRATTAGAKSCETIPEDPEVDGSVNEELLSIDRTLLSSSTAATAQPAACFPQPRSSFRLASPFPQPPPIFEILPPAYSPPDPPTETNCAVAEGGNTTRSNLTSPDQSSYGGQTPLNTTTGSSESPSGTGGQGKVRISELECSDVGPSGVVAEMEALEGCWPQPGPNSREIHVQPCLAPTLAGLPPGRVPRSISQQLELMEEMAAAAASAKFEQKA